MSRLGTTLPTRRPELILRPLGERGQYVVKDPRTGAYFHLGEHESFLLSRLDGRSDAGAICTAFREQFCEPLTGEELEEFLGLAEARGFLQSADSNGNVAESQEARPRHASDSPAPGVAARRAPRPRHQSILYWRKSLFDPDRLFSGLAPRLWFLWTRGFVVVWAVCVMAAAAVLWANQDSLVSSFRQGLRWETLILVWLTLLLVTACHEFAHGLTCKHHGGEVHEIGVLLLFLMPCLYCNVSDAWLFKEKSKRLWVTFAGGYFELFLWALAVFVWRLTLPGGLLSHLACVVLSVCAVRTLFNFNPLIKLDGYYLLSDCLEMPNLQQRALGRFKGHLRRLLWGAPRPTVESRGRLLSCFGLATWVYSLAFLAVMLAVLFKFAGARWGLFGGAGVALLGMVTVRRVSQGISAGEMKKMFLLRHKRVAVWLVGLGALAAVLCLVELEDRAGGPFQIRPRVRAELRAPVSGFLKQVDFDEGDRVSPGAVVARLEIPDLTSRIARKRAEVRETSATLRLLEAGPRSEELIEQRGRVDRAEAWCELAEQDLRRTRRAFDEDLIRLDKKIAAWHAQLEYVQDAYERAKQLAGRKVVSEEEYENAERQRRVIEAELEQAEAEKRALQAKGAMVAEAELALREKELADARAALSLLEAGSRPEEIEAERARLARLEEELRYLEQLSGKLLVSSPVPGLITTPRPKERVGEYIREGESIVVVEDTAGLDAEIALAEQEVARVRAGQAALLKVRALPLEGFAARVERIAPAVRKSDVECSLTVCCRVEAASEVLRPGMTGYARIATGRRPIGAIILDRAMRLVRTEFWW